MDRFLELLAQERPKNEIVMELFCPVGDDYLRRVGAALSRWSLQITLESHVERIRHLNRRFACSNEAIEHTIGEALASGAGRVDIFFMVGLPGQTYEDAVGCVDFCRSLLERFGASGAWRSSSRRWRPSSTGQRRLRRPGALRLSHTLPHARGASNGAAFSELEGHVELRDGVHDARPIVAATYEAMRRMARLKREWGFLDEEAFAEEAGHH